jgi:hypothetical protein
MPLTKEEVILVRELFVQGPGLLYERGWAEQQAKEFLKRAEVVSYLQILGNEAREQVGMNERTKFDILRRMRQLVPRAMDLYERALQKPVYLRNPKTKKLLRDKNKQPIVDHRHTPNAMQLDVSRDMFDRVGIRRDSEINAVASAGVEEVFNAAAKPVLILYDPELDEAGRTLSREKVRAKMLELMPTLPKVRKKVEKNIGKRRKPNGL